MRCMPAVRAQSEGFTDSSDTSAPTVVPFEGASEAAWPMTYDCNVPFVRPAALSVALVCVAVHGAVPAAATAVIQCGVPAGFAPVVVSTGRFTSDAWKAAADEHSVLPVETVMSCKSRAVAGGAVCGNPIETCLQLVADTVPGHAMTRSTARRGTSQ